MSETRTYRGGSLEELLPRIRAELGDDAVVVRQREGLTGGVAGTVLAGGRVVRWRSGGGRGRDALAAVHEPARGGAGAGAGARARGDRRAGPRAASGRRGAAARRRPAAELAVRGL